MPTRRPGPRSGGALRPGGGRGRRPGCPVCGLLSSGEGPRQALAQAEEREVSGLCWRMSAVHKAVPVRRRPGPPHLARLQTESVRKTSYCAQSPSDAHPALPDGCRPVRTPNISTCQNTWPSSPAGGKANLDLNQEGGIVPLQIEE